MTKDVTQSKPVLVLAYGQEMMGLPIVRSLGRPGVRGDGAVSEQT